MDRKITTLEFWKEAWRLILKGVDENGHPYNTPAFGTTSPQGKSRQRIVVLRKANRELEELSFYTDIRSTKAHHLQEKIAEGSWLFWDPESKIQFMGGGPTRWADRSVARKTFDNLPKYARKAYATLSAPGEAISTSNNGLPDDWDARSLEETDYAFDNFGILITTLNWAEVLQLDRNGNLRMTAEREDDNWKLEWVTP